MGTRKIIELSAFDDRRPTTASLTVAEETPRLIPFDRLGRGHQETKAVRRMLGTQEFRRRIACGDYLPDPEAIAVSLLDRLFGDLEDPSQSR